MPSGYIPANPFNGVAPVVANNLNASTSTAPLQPQCNVIWIDTMDDILNHPTSPNTQLYFAEKSSPTMWMRETDGNGKIKNPLHRLSYTVEEVPFGPEANFVTKEEFARLFDVVKSQSNKLDELIKKWE